MMMVKIMIMDTSANDQDTNYNNEDILIGRIIRKAVIIKNNATDSKNSNGDNYDFEN